MAGLASRTAVWSTAPQLGIADVSQYLLVGFGSGPKLGSVPWAKDHRRTGSFFSTTHLKKGCC